MLSFQDRLQIAEKSNTVVALAQLKLSFVGLADKLGQANWYRTSTSLSETGPAYTKPNLKKIFTERQHLLTIYVNEKYH